MKKTEKIRKEAELAMVKIKGITRHIRNVEDNCLLLGEKLILSGEIGLGHKLISKGFVHDASKFAGIEWEHMAPGQPNQAEEGAKVKLRLAIQHHQKTNDHHPEFWGGITHMPKVSVAEMVCDWKARSEEFGESLRDFINEKATKKYDFSKDDVVYKQIMEFVNLICDKPFEQQTQS